MTEHFPQIVMLLPALLGLLLPGYALARMLRIDFSLAAAFPFSALLICLSVELLAITGLSITVLPVGGLLIAATVVFAAIILRRSPAGNRVKTPAADYEAAPVPLLQRTALLAAFLLTAAVFFRTCLYPLGGFDTFTRWDALAREMLISGSLDYYPPVRPEHFAVYFMPDGFPPLVASVYWWLYAASGSAAPQLTAISVSLQLVSLLWLIYKTAATAFCRACAPIALLAAIATPLLSNAVAIGQESGFLVLAVTGQLCAALAARERPAMGTVAAAALFAALGAMGREYGPALALPGFALLLTSPQSRRLAWRFLLLVVLIIAPWYLHVWLMTGNPLYPRPLPGGLPGNSVLIELIRYYQERFSVTGFSAAQWLALAVELLRSCGITLIAGLPFLLAAPRRHAPWLATVALVAGLWLWSIGQTSGGVIYSTRVLAPAAAILAIAVSGACSRLAAMQRFTRLATTVAGILLVLAGSGILSALAYPFSIRELPTALFSKNGVIPDYCAPHLAFARTISALPVTPTGILTDSPYLAVLLRRETDFRPFIIWNPAVSFVFDQTRDPAEVQQRLQQLGIGMVALNRSSIHNDLLGRFPFYQQGGQNWSPLASSGDWELFTMNAGVSR